MNMDNYESKMAKSLQYHNLQNLVFQKRQRKVIQQNIVQLPTKIQKNKPQIIKNISLSKRSNIFHKKQNKQAQNKTKNINKKAIDRKTKQISKKQSHKDKKNIVKKAGFNKKKFKRILRKKINELIVNKKNVIEKRKTIKKEQQKINKEILKNSQQKQEIQENIGSPMKKKGRPRKIIQVQADQNIEQRNHNQNISQKNNSRNMIPNEQIQPRVRQAKLNALKKYSQKLIFPSDEQQNQRIMFSSNKRKKINKPQSYYSINRIFRKQAKLDLNYINIPIKLNQLTFPAFVNKFGTFDVIHTSLPISFLWELTGIQNLMIKGFIFIWIEKGQIPLGYHLLNRLGYDVIDQIIWIKCNENQRIVYSDTTNIQETTVSQSNLFKNSKSMCMVGYKCPIGQKAEYRTKISNNIIFAQNSLNPIKKPDQIYEIADLLMPGSRKLQLGGPPQKGWLSLNHIQTRINTCYKCFKNNQSQIKLWLSQKQSQIFSICNKCLNNKNQLNQAQLSNSNNSQSQSQQQIQQNSTINVSKFQYLSQLEIFQCNKCLAKQNINQLIKCSCQIDHYYCKNCFYEQFTNHLTHKSCEIKIKKKLFLNQQNIKCSNCQKNNLIQKYYQCTASNCKNKIHILCVQCFWQIGSNLINQQNYQQINKKKNDGLHQFKMKKIISHPNQKLFCLCKNQLILPYYICETCVGWRWCRKCELPPNQLNKHKLINSNEQSQNQQHKISLIY